MIAPRPRGITATTAFRHPVASQHQPCGSRTQTKCGIAPESGELAARHAARRLTYTQVPRLEATNTEADMPDRLERIASGSTEPDEHVLLEFARKHVFGDEFDEIALVAPALLGERSCDVSESSAASHGGCLLIGDDFDAYQHSRDPCERTCVVLENAIRAVRGTESSPAVDDVCLLVGVDYDAHMSTAEGTEPCAAGDERPLTGDDYDSFERARSAIEKAILAVSTGVDTDAHKHFSGSA